jgi:hypothetical protein
MRDYIDSSIPSHIPVFPVVIFLFYSLKPISDPHHLNMDFPGVRTVELAQQDVLPDAKLQFALDDWNGKVLPDDQYTQVRVGILAVAVGEERIVVFVIYPPRNELFEERGDVGEQSALGLIEHQTGRRM